MSALLLGVLLLAAPTPTPAPGPMSLDATPVPRATVAPAAPAPSAPDAPGAKPVATPVPAAVPTPKRAAIVVVGDDAGASGDLQRDLERRLASAVPGLVVRPASDVAARIATPRPPPPPPAIDPSAATFLEQAIGAYYDAQFVKALDLFAKVQALYESADAPVSRKTEVLLWRVAVFLGLNDLVQAQQEALAALALNPELKVDPKSEVPPSVQQQLDRVRASASFKVVTVIVNGLPPTASLSVDGRSVPSRFKVLAGKHKLIASSTGRRDVIRELDVSADTAITVSLPISLAPETEAALRAWIWSAEKNTAEPADVAALAQKLDADWVIFAAAQGAQARAALRRSSTGALERTEALALAEAAPAVAGTFGARIATSSDEKPVTETAGFVIDDGTWTVHTRGTLVASGWLRSLSGGEKFETFFGGAGPELRAEVTKGRLLLVGAGSWISYDASSVDVTLPDGSKKSATGGSTARLLAGGGWRGFGPDGGRFRALLSVDAEIHDANDPTNRGAALHLLTSYTRAAVQLRGGMRTRAPLFSRLLLDVELGLSPWAFFAEDPEGASGDSPAPGLAYLWSAGLESAPSASSRWGYRLTYAGELRSVKFDGAADAAVSPPMRDATLSEMFHALSLSVTRRF